MRTEPHLLLVHRKVPHAAAKLEQLLTRVAVALVLGDGIGDGLFRKAVLQLERGYGQPIDEKRHVERALGLVTAVAKLARYAEAIARITLGRLLVAGRGCAVKEVDVMRAVLDSVAQDVDGAPLRDLPLEARQELAPRRTVHVQLQ